MSGISLGTRLTHAFNRLQQIITYTMGRGAPPESLCLLEIHENSRFKQQEVPSLREILNEGFLWAVPKHRRTLEKRLNRRFGLPEYTWKLLKPKSTIKTCNTCGDDYESGHLCPSCYKKVIDETKLMQDAIQEKLQLNPVDKEVVVLYDGEKDEKLDEFYEGKRIVEMKKERPAWFSRNLLQQTTQKPATTADVKPSELG